MKWNRERNWINLAEFLLCISVVFLFVAGCKNSGKKLNANALLGLNTAPYVLYSDPVPGATNVSPTSPINVYFSKSINREDCIKAFSTSPQVTGSFSVIGANLEFTPNTSWSNETYVFTVNKNCEDDGGRDLKDTYQADFTIGSGTGPTVSNVTFSNVSLASGSSCSAGSQSQTIQTGGSEQGVCVNSTIQVSFSVDMNETKTEQALFLTPTTTTQVTWPTSKTLVMTPASGFTANTGYVLTISTNAVDTTGQAIANNASVSFQTENTSPHVQAIGLVSQGCSSTYPGTGNSSGGDWTLGSCWWDDSLTVLDALSYSFRAGDTGAGSSGDQVTDCTDVNTDDIRVIFSDYMNMNSTINALSLNRLSPPSTNIRLSTYTWHDCQGTLPGGCRVLDLEYAEEEASCNGALAWGTNGDYNLSKTIGTPSNVPIYTLSISTSANTASGQPLSSSFSFSFVGN